MNVDLALVRLVEHTAARHCVLQAGTLEGSSVMLIDGGALIGMGPSRYVNRAFGIGLGGTPADVVCRALESFYGTVGMAPTIEVTPWAHESLIAELSARNYTTKAFTNVYAHELRRLPTRSDVTIREVDGSLEAAWAAIPGAASPEGSQARATSDEYSTAMRRLPDSLDLVAIDGGQPAAAASFTRLDDIASFGGAATLAASRGRGLQTALLADRLHRAQAAGCTMAIATAHPAGTSARNLLRAGFQMLYSRAVMTRT